MIHNHLIYKHELFHHSLFSQEKFYFKIEFPRVRWGRGRIILWGMLGEERRTEKEKRNCAMDDSVVYNVLCAKENCQSSSDDDGILFLVCKHVEARFWGTACAESLDVIFNNHSNHEDDCPRITSDASNHTFKIPTVLDIVRQHGFPCGSTWSMSESSRLLNGLLCGINSD